MKFRLYARDNTELLGLYIDYCSKEFWSSGRDMTVIMFAFLYGNLDVWAKLPKGFYILEPVDDLGLPNSRTFDIPDMATSVGQCLIEALSR